METRWNTHLHESIWNLHDRYIPGLRHCTRLIDPTGIQTPRCTSTTDRTLHGNRPLFRCLSGSSVSLPSFQNDTRILSTRSRHRHGVTVADDIRVRVWWILDLRHALASAESSQKEIVPVTCAVPPVGVALTGDSVPRRPFVDETL